MSCIGQTPFKLENTPAPKFELNKQAAAANMTFGGEESQPKPADLSRIEGDKLFNL
jgi:hypothetical protein